MGLVDAVHPDAELASAARALGHQLAKGPAQAQARIKALIGAAPHNSLSQHLDAERDAMFASGETDDGHEGIRAFIEKRAPKCTYSKTLKKREHYESRRLQSLGSA